MKVLGLQQIPIESLKVSPLHSRKVDKKCREFTELVDSVKAVGVIIPLMVYQNGDGYVYMAGQRRIEAAKKAGLTDVPCIVHVVTDAESADITFIENAFRQALTPMEEARMVSTVVDKYKGDVNAAATALGQTAQWVASRCKVVNGLIDPIVTLLSGKDYETEDRKYEIDDYQVLGLYGISHLAEIAKMPVHMQWELLNDELGDLNWAPKLVEELAAWRKDREKDLSSATWPLDKVMVFPRGTDCLFVRVDDKPGDTARECVGCPDNSNSNALLFDADPKKTGQCMNKTCYAMKSYLTVFRDFEAIQAKNDKAVFVADEHRTINLVQHICSSALTDTWKYSACKKSDKGSVFMYFASGKKPGYYRQTSGVQTANKVASEADAKTAPRTDAQKKEDRKKLLTAKRQVWMNHELCTMMQSAKLGCVVVDDKNDCAVRLAIEFGAPLSSYGSESHQTAAAGDWYGQLFFNTLNPIIRSIKYNGTLAGWTKKHHEQTVRFAKLFQVDLDDLQKRAEAENPMPKSLR